MNRRFVCILALIAIVFSNTRLGFAQSSSNNQATKIVSEKQEVQLSTNAEKVKRALMKIGQSEDATIFLQNGAVFLGSVRSIEATQVLFYNRETKQLVEIEYEDVEKVWKGLAIRGDFGNWVKAKHRKIGNIVAFASVIVLVLVVPIVALSRSRD